MADQRPLLSLPLEGRPSKHCVLKEAVPVQVPSQHGEPALSTFSLNVQIVLKQS